jgi:acetamidase/formamidase
MTEADVVQQRPRTSARRCVRACAALSIASAAFVGPVVGSALALFVLPAGAQAQPPTTHELPLTPANVHWGFFDARVPPVARIRPGDRLNVQTMVARGLERPRLAGMRDDRFHAAELAVEAAVRERGPGAHPMTGPIWVEGAEPGDALEVRIERIELLTDWGVSGFLPGGGTIPDDFPYGAIRLFQLDAATRTARMGALPLRIPLAPFFGTIGVAPPVLSGRISTGPPGPHTGNLDNKDLVAGTSLFLPVLVEGALLSIGDGHAAQGDGEVSGTAIETSLSGTVQVLLHKGAGRRWPWAETPTHYMSMGLHPDLDEAARIATLEMVNFLVASKGMDRDDAYILCSVALDLRVTQLVDGTKGVHGMLAKSLFP